MFKIKYKLLLLLLLFLFQYIKLYLMRENKRVKFNIKFLCEENKRE